MRPFHSLFRSLLATGILLTSLPARPVSAQAEKPEVVPGEILVGVRPKANRFPMVQTMTSKIGRVVDALDRLGVYTVKLRAGQSMESALAEMRRRSDVRYAEPNYVMHIASPPSDALYSSQYAPQITQTDLAWSLWNPQLQVVVAIVDTGVNSAHPDLTNKIFRNTTTGAVIGYDFVNNDTNPADDHGHGTHCAGIAAAQVNNGVGVAGVAGWDGVAGHSDTSYVKIMPVKVMDASGAGNTTLTASGITWAVDNGANVISLSLGGASSSSTLDTAVAYAWSHGCIVVAAAGNSSSNAVFYPAGCTNVLSVASTDNTDTLSSFSNYGSWVKVAAPGSNILSTSMAGGYVTLSGTSMACPFVAGEAALLWAHAPSLTNSQIINLITSNVDPYTPYSGHTIATGAGRVNVYSAISAISSPGAPALAGVSLSSATGYGGCTLTGTVTLSAAATGGESITLTSSNTAAATVPSNVTFTGGATTATFTVTVPSVTTTASTTITASYNGRNRTAALTTKPLLGGVSLGAVTVGSTVTATGNILLNGPAPTGGATITLTCADSHVTLTPSSVSIAAGATTGTFSISAAAGMSYPATITGTCLGYSQSATLTIASPPLSAIRVNPNAVYGGQSVTGTIQLAGLAPPGGAAVAVAVDMTSYVTVPSVVTVPAGQSYVNFTITTSPVPRTSVARLVAYYRGVLVQRGLKLYH